MSIKPRPKIPDQVKALAPLWKTDTEQIKLKLNKAPYSVFVATPVHDQCSIHYTQGLLEFQQLCIKRNVDVTFAIMK